jgi:hypothetical protein
MTYTDIAPSLVALKLASAVGHGNVPEIRLIASEVDWDKVQDGGITASMIALRVAAQIDKVEFPNDVWSAVPTFLLSDIPDRAVVLGAEEEYLGRVVSFFLTNGLKKEFSGESAEKFDPTTIAGGHFLAACGVGESVYAIIKVIAEQKFEGDYQKASNLITSVAEMQDFVANAE